MKAITEQIPLRLPTSATKAGPRLVFDADCLKVEYDFEHQDGSAEIAHLRFREVLAIEWKQASCSRADNITDSGVLIRMSDSPYLDKILLKWQNSVGWQEYQNRLGGAKRFSHYHLFFDDAGSLSVVASNFTLG